MPPCPSPARRALSGAVILFALTLLSGPAAAHAVVVNSEPVAGASLEAAPARVTIRFNSRLDHARSRLLLIGEDNSQTALPIREDGDPIVLEAPLPGPVAPGAWRLRWQVLAVDGHITRGDIPFTIRGR